MCMTRAQRPRTIITAEPCAPASIRLAMMDAGSPGAVTASCNAVDLSCSAAVCRVDQC